MTEKELEVLEEKLKICGYERSTSSGKEDYGWYKTVNKDTPECYTIEFRIWDFTAYRGDYEIDVLVIAGGQGNRLDLTVTYPRFDIPTIENLAEDFNLLTDKYIKYGTKM